METTQDAVGVQAMFERWKSGLTLEWIAEYAGHWGCPFCPVSLSGDTPCYADNCKEWILKWGASEV